MIDLYTKWKERKFQEKIMRISVTSGVTDDERRILESYLINPSPKNTVLAREVFSELRTEWSRSWESLKDKKVARKSHTAKSIREILGCLEYVLPVVMEREKQYPS